MKKITKKLHVLNKKSILIMFLRLKVSYSLLYLKVSNSEVSRQYSTFYVILCPSNLISKFFFKRKLIFFYAFRSTVYCCNFSSLQISAVLRLNVLYIYKINYLFNFYIFFSKLALSVSREPICVGNNLKQTHWLLISVYYRTLWQLAGLSFQRKTPHDLLHTASCKNTPDNSLSSFQYKSTYILRH